MACLLTQPHQNYNYIIEQPLLTTCRNQVEQKSANYKIKETTSIQTGRRGEDAEWAGPTYPSGGKIWEGYLRSEGSQPHTRPPAQDTSAIKIGPITSSCKNQQVLSW